MDVDLITEQQFIEFFNDYKGPMHSMHAPLYYKNIKERTDTHLLGLKDKNGKLIGVSILSEYPLIQNFKALATHSGPVIKDFTNEKLEKFIQGIDTYAKKTGAVMITFSPYTIYQMRDSEGNVIDDHPANNHSILKLFDRNDYKHAGLTKRMIYEEAIRFQSVVDISGDLDTILNNMSRVTRYNTRQTERLPLKIKYLHEDEYDTFIKIYKDTEERLGFDPIPAERIRLQLETFKDTSYIVLAQIDLDAYESQLEKELNAYEVEYKKIDEKEKKSRRDKSKLNELTDLVNSRKNRLKKTQNHKEQYGSVIDLSVGMYYYNDHEMVYLYSGSYPEHSQYLGTNYMTWEMIKKAKELGLKRFNMYGITGNFEEDASDYGVFKFKQGYNAYIEELPGTFTKVYRSFVYKLYELRNKF